MVYYNEKATQDFKKTHKGIVKLCYDIAKHSGNPAMCKRDVHYVCGNMGYFSPHKVYVDVTQDSYLVASINKGYIRIYGLATRLDKERQGGGGRLLNNLYAFARQKGIKTIKILTETGAEYFARKGFFPEEIRGKEFLMTKQL